MIFNDAWSKRLVDADISKKNVQLRINFDNGSTATMVTSVYTKDEDGARAILERAWDTFCTESFIPDSCIDGIIVENVDTSWTKIEKRKAPRLTA